LSRRAQPHRDETGKNLRAQILFEHQQTMDGNTIDNGWSDANDVNGQQRNTINLERAWIQYDIPNTGLTMEVGARLWTTDAAGVLGDDDPRFALFYKTGNLEFQAAAVIQTESLRFGFENDNDDVYYTFGVDYDMKPAIWVPWRVLSVPQRRVARSDVGSENRLVHHHAQCERAVRHREIPRAAHARLWRGRPHRRGCGDVRRAEYGYLFLGSHWRCRGESGEDSAVLYLCDWFG
jgi:hypothetical protein